MNCHWGNNWCWFRLLAITKAQVTSLSPLSDVNIIIGLPLVVHLGNSLLVLFEHLNSVFFFFPVSIEKAVYWTHLVWSARLLNGRKRYRSKLMISWLIFVLLLNGRELTSSPFSYSRLVIIAKLLKEWVIYALLLILILLDFRIISLFPYVLSFDRKQN